MHLVELHPHARERAPERGTTEEEIVETVLTGQRFPAKFGRGGSQDFRSMIVSGAGAGLRTKR
jgi:hypothetical protein